MLVPKKLSETSVRLREEVTRASGYIHGMDGSSWFLYAVYKKIILKVPFSELLLYHSMTYINTHFNLNIT